MSEYPEALQRIIDLFEGLSEVEKRENLVSYAERAGACAPREGEVFLLEDVRKDEECTDTVGVFLRDLGEGRVGFRVTLGEKVQTLTKAMASILCRGLEGCTVDEVLELPSGFVPQIVGGHLVRIRSQTVYYLLSRMKTACKILRDRQRAGAHK